MGLKKKKKNRCSVCDKEGSTTCVIRKCSYIYIYVHIYINSWHLFINSACIFSIDLTWLVILCPIWSILRKMYDVEGTLWLHHMIILKSIDVNEKEVPNSHIFDTLSISLYVNDPIIFTLFIGVFYSRTSHRQNGSELALFNAHVVSEDELGQTSLI